MTENNGLRFGRLRAMDQAWLEAKFWPRVDKTDACWLWTGLIRSNGYGQIHLGNVGRTSVPMLTHRFSWLVAQRLLEVDRQLDHLCRVRACCNPDHLESVTQQINMMRAYEHQTHCKNGHEFTPENTQWYGKYGTKRNCRTCNRAAMKAYRARKRSAAL